MDFERRGLGYVARFPEQGAEMALDRIRNTQGEVKGELTVESAHSSYDGAIARAAFNVSSLTARKSWAKTLEERAEGKHWQEALEQFCIAVLGADREGAPIVSVGREPLDQKDAYLLEPFLLRNRTTILYGQGGSGKSYFAAALAVAVASGKSPIPTVTHPKGTYPGPVVILDWEADAAEWNERLMFAALGTGNGPPDNIKYRACAGPFSDIAEKMAGYVDEFNVPLVIVDSAGLAAPPGDGDPSQTALKMFAGFRLLSTSVLLIDHVKGDELDKPGKVNKPYGSIYKVNSARSVWELKAVGDPDQDGTRHIAVHHRKVNRGALRPTQAFSVYHDEGSVTWTPESISTQIVQDAGGKVTHATAIAAVLMDMGALTDEQIAEETGVSLPSVRSTLHRHKRDFPRLSDGRYRIEDGS